MGKFTVIPQDTFKALQLDAGVLLKRFNPANPVAPADEDIICATTGGVNPSCVPSFSDMGEDVDNVPVNMKELKKLDSWECKISTTSLGTSPELIRLALGCADVDAQTSKIVPRADLKQTDFSDIWWVGDRADGGLVAVQLKNALATSGFSLQTTKNGKGQIALELTGHVSIDDQKTVPMVFYSMDPTEGVTYKVSQILAHVTSSFVDAYATAGDSFEATLTAETDYEIASVVVTMAGEDITSDAWSSATGKVTIASVTGNINIVATATEGA
jgi:hypothetical protein